MHGSWAALPAYDPFSADFASDPPAALAHLRRQSWAARDPFGISVLRHDEVAALVRDQRLVEWGLDLWRAQGIVAGPLIDWARRILPSRDATEHAVLRRLLNPLFTPRSLEPLRPRLRAQAEQLLDGLAGGGPHELMSTYADPFAAGTVAALLGLGAEAELQIIEHAATLGSAFNLAIGDSLPAIEQALAALGDLADHLLDQPGATPLVRRLADPTVDRSDARALAIEIVESGYDTLRNQIGCSLVLCMDHPEQWARLRREPRMVETAVDEFPRYLPAIPVALRIAATDVEVHGVTIPAGTFVSLLTASANRDERVFERADTFDVTRTGRVPLAYGGGPHACLGVSLARLGLTEAIGAPARRDMVIERAEPVTWRSLVGVRGPTSLRVSLPVVTA
jgi:hypothetical protein